MKQPHENHSSTITTLVPSSINPSIPTVNQPITIDVISITIEVQSTQSNNDTKKEMRLVLLGRLPDGQTSSDLMEENHFATSDDNPLLRKEFSLDWMVGIRQMAYGIYHLMFVTGRLTLTVTTTIVKLFCFRNFHWWQLSTTRWIVNHQTCTISIQNGTC